MKGYELFILLFFAILLLVQFFSFNNPRSQQAAIEESDQEYGEVVAEATTTIPGPPIISTQIIAETSPPLTSPPPSSPPPTSVAPTSVPPLNNATPASLSTTTPPLVNITIAPPVSTTPSPPTLTIPALNPPSNYSAAIDCKLDNSTCSRCELCDANSQCVVNSSLCSTPVIIASEGFGAVWGVPVVMPILRAALHGISYILTQNGNYTSGCPDLIVRSHFLNMEGDIPGCYNVPYITWNAESRYVSYRPDGRPPIAAIDNLINQRNDHPLKPALHLWTPFTVAYIPPSRKREFQGNATARQNFLAYLNSNCVPQRDKMFRLLCAAVSHKNTCHGLGRCSHSPNVPAVEGLPVSTFSNYAFVLCMENRNVAGYVTEKLANALLSGAIPIYGGGGGYAKLMFNPKAFISVDDFPSEEDAVRYIATLYQNKTEMQRIMDEPMFPPEYTAASIYKEDGVTLTPLYSSYAEAIRQELRKRRII